MVCLSEVFGVDAVLVFLEDFIVAFLLTAGDATMTEFFVADSGLNRDGTTIPYGNAVLFGNVADTRICSDTPPRFYRPDWHGPVLPQCAAPAAPHRERGSKS